VVYSLLIPEAPPPQGFVSSTIFPVPIIVPYSPLSTKSPHSRIVLMVYQIWGRYRVPLDLIVNGLIKIFYTKPRN